MKLSPAIGERSLTPSAQIALEKTTITGAATAAVVAPDVVVGPEAEMVQAAQAQLAAMPEIDAARVAAIRQALARGEISFDPQKLAGLVMRHHGGRG